MLQKKQVLNGPVLEEERLKSIKTIHHHIRLFMESLKICFDSPTPTVCASRAFVYGAVNVNNIVTVSSTKPSLYSHVQVSIGLILYLG